MINKVLRLARPCFCLGSSTGELQYHPYNPLACYLPLAILTTIDNGKAAKSSSMMKLIQHTQLTQQNKILLPKYR